MESFDWSTFVFWAAMIILLLFTAGVHKRFFEGEEGDAVVKSMAFDATFISIILIMGFVPQLGYITIVPGISLTLMHIPVLIGAYVGGWKKGLLYGTAFGITSWIMALMNGSGLNAFFIYPWVSVLPRMAFGLLAGLVFLLVSKQPKLYRSAPFIGLLAFLLTVAHTCLVFGDLFAFYPSDMSSFFGGSGVIQGVSMTVLAIIAIGAAGEAALGAILTPAVGKALLKSKGSWKERKHA